jgi:hypothetical protein
MACLFQYPSVCIKIFCAWCQQLDCVQNLTMPRQCVALHICHPASMGCVTHLSPCLSALRYTFVTPRQCVALHIGHPRQWAPLHICHPASVRGAAHLPRQLCYVPLVVYVLSQTPLQVGGRRTSSAGIHHGIQHLCCVTRLSPRSSALRSTFVTLCQTVSALRYTFVTPNCQCAALQICHAYYVYVTASYALTDALASRRAPPAGVHHGAGARRHGFPVRCVTHLSH